MVTYGSFDELGPLLVARARSTERGQLNGHFRIADREIDGIVESHATT
jgi:hypothetical protein